MDTTPRDATRGVAGRVTAAILLGYGVTAASQTAVAAALAHVIGKGDAVWLGTMLILPVFPAAMIYAFGARSARRAWLGLTAAIAAFALLRWALA